MAASLLPFPTNQFSLHPEEATFTPLLEKCPNIQVLKQIHTQMIKTGLVLETISASKLLTALCKTSSTTRTGLTYSLQFFNKLHEPNTFMWNTIIRAFSTSKYPEEAILLYCQMLYNAAPHNLYTFPFLLKACNFEETQQIHCHIIKNCFASELHTINSLLHNYAKYGFTLSARKLFNCIPCKDIVSWNSMIDGYAKSGQIELARSFFDLMQEKNVISWTSMVSGYIENFLFNEALELFHEMQQKGIEPDKVALTSALSACAQLGSLDQGRWIHNYIKRKRIRLDEVLACVLVDMYSKCGELDQAQNIFKKLEEKRNVSLWTAMITGFAVHGRGEEALLLFKEMEAKGITPNEITFTGLLTACSYSGLVNEGKLMFKRMVKYYEMSPTIEHYGCMVDLLGRAGLLKEAEKLIMTMPLKPTAAIWGALLSACQAHKDYKMGSRVGKWLIKLEPNHGGRYVKLASIFASQGEWNRAAVVRKMMKQRGVSKTPGSSWISLDGKVHEFFAGDWSHKEMENIHAQWSRTLDSLKGEGYTPQMEDLLLDLDEEEKESAVHCHSEKLAITFGLIRTELGATIRIFKNLRVCKDCHTVSKFVSKLYNRKIIMRDRTRFHIFEDGHCSCRDYW